MKKQPCNYTKRQWKVRQKREEITDTFLCTQSQLLPINKDVVVVKVHERTWLGRLQHTDTDLALRGASEPHFDDRRGKVGRKEGRNGRGQQKKRITSRQMRALGRMATVKKVNFKRAS